MGADNACCARACDAGGLFVLTRRTSVCAVFLPGAGPSNLNPGTGKLRHAFCALFALLLAVL